MTYLRVVPRDLFNEASLLKCMGRLAIALDNRVSREIAQMDEGDGSPFSIEQDPNSGAIEVINLRLWVRGKAIRLLRPLNSRQPWPLYAEPSLDEEWFDPISVFTDEGDLTEEFEAFVGLAHEGRD